MASPPFGQNYHDEKVCDRGGQKKIIRQIKMKFMTNMDSSLEYGQSGKLPVTGNIPVWQYTSKNCRTYLNN